MLRKQLTNRTNFQTIRAIQKHPTIVRMFRKLTAQLCYFSDNSHNSEKVTNCQKIQIIHEVVRMFRIFRKQSYRVPREPPTSIPDLEQTLE